MEVRNQSKPIFVRLHPEPYSETEFEYRIMGTWKHSDIKWDVKLEIVGDEFVVGWSNKRCDQSFPFGRVEHYREAFFEDHKLVTVEYKYQEPGVEHYRREWFFVGDNLISTCEMAENEVIICRRV